MKSSPRKKILTPTSNANETTLKFRTKATNWGNSLSIRIPQAITSNLQINGGDEIELILENAPQGSFLVRKIPTVPTLKELVEKVTKDNKHNINDWSAPIGEELI